MKEHLLPLKFSIPDRLTNTLFFKYLNEDLPKDNKSGFQLQIITDSQVLGEVFMQAFTSYGFAFNHVTLLNISTLHSQDISNLIPVITDDQMSEELITVVVSTDQKALKACFDAMQFREKHFNVSLVQPSVGEKNAIDRVMIDLREPCLNRLNIVGTQAHRSDVSFADNHTKHGLNVHRLGVLRNDMSTAEPDIRDSEIFGIDINSIKNSDAQEQSRPTVVGLTAEECSQLSYYAGRSERNKVFSLYGAVKEVTDSKQGMDLFATLVWYFLHGLEHRRKLYPPSEKSMNSYQLEHKIGDLSLTFYKDENTEKWWVASPFPKSKLTKSFPLIACDYQDYSLAANEEMLSPRLDSIFDKYRLSIVNK